MNFTSLRLVLLGPPGAGKGTQAQMMCDKFHIPQISTGDILRSEVKAGSEIGLEAKGFMDQGLLVPDSVVIRIVQKRLSEDDSKSGYILDGFPRTVNQAEAMIENEIGLDHVIFFDVDDEILVQRLSGRRVCPSCKKMYHIMFKPPQKDELCDICSIPLVTREDDTEDTIVNRIKVYRKQTEPLIVFYNDSDSVHFYRIDNGPDGKDTPEDIMNRVVSILTDRISK